MSDLQTMENNLEQWQILRQIIASKGKGGYRRLPKNQLDLMRRIAKLEYKESETKEKVDDKYQCQELSTLKIKLNNIVDNYNKKMKNRKYKQRP